MGDAPTHSRQPRPTGWLNRCQSQLPLTLSRTLIEAVGGAGGSRGSGARDGATTLEKGGSHLSSLIDSSYTSRLRFFEKVGKGKFICLPLVPPAPNRSPGCDSRYKQGWRRTLVPSRSFGNTVARKPGRKRSERERLTVSAGKP